MAGSRSNELRSRAWPSTAHPSAQILRPEVALAPGGRRAFEGVQYPMAALTTKLVFATLALATLCTPIGAEEIPLNRWWIHTGGYTHHINNNKNRNGETYGLGLEYKFSETQSLRAGVFNNSFDRSAPYLSYAWLPLQWGPFRVGGNASIAGGYTHNRTGALAAVIPWGEITWKYVGLELGVAPVKNGIVTALFKFRFN